jgi:exodeoxyribonuclease VII small subunit
MAKKKKSTKKTPTFEEQMTTLEEIADELESGELGLEQAIARYEEGVKCYRRCHKILAEAEKKVEVLTRAADGGLEARPFDEEEAPVAEDDDAAEDDDEDDDGESLF